MFSVFYSLLAVEYLVKRKWNHKIYTHLDCFTALNENTCCSYVKLVNISIRSLILHTRHDNWAVAESVNFWPGAHFTNDFSIVIQMRWKFHSSLIQVVSMWSLSHFAHGTTAVLSLHVQNFVAIRHTTMELRWPIFYRIWITMEKSFVKWAPGAISVMLFQSLFKFDGQSFRLWFTSRLYHCSSLQRLDHSSFTVASCKKYCGDYSVRTWGESKINFLSNLNSMGNIFNETDHQVRL